MSASLVKYHTPILVSVTAGKKGSKGAKKPSQEKQTTQTEDILNSILPPRYDHFINLAGRRSLSAVGRAAP